MYKKDLRGSAPSPSFKSRPGFSNDASSCSRVEVLRVVRLLLEALETAFFLANIYLEHYGVAKILDIMNQIMPTAYVYNTGYWVFYNNQYSQAICVCNRFGIRCPHLRNDLHFVNLDLLIENPQSHCLRPFREKLYPAVANIKVTPVLSDVLRAYDTQITITVQPLRFQNNQFDITSKEKASFTMETRYILTPEHCPLENSVAQFDPSPMAHHAYTSYFQTMKRFQYFPTENGFETQVPRTYTIVPIDLPRFGIVPNMGSRTQLLNPDALILQCRNNSVFPEGLSHIWTNPDDNSCNIRLRGGHISHITLSSVTFIGQRPSASMKRKQNEPPKRSQRRVRMDPKLGPSEPALSPVPENEQNFRGPDYENSFPSLPQVRCVGNNLLMPETKEESAETVQVADGEKSTKTLVDVEVPTYADRVASASITNRDPKKPHDALLRMGPGGSKDDTGKNKENVQKKEEAKNSGTAANDRLNVASSSTSTADQLIRSFFKRTL